MRRVPASYLVYVGLGLALSAVPACDCGGAAGVCEESGTSCTLDEECDICCGQDELGVCLTGACVCTDDVPWGRFGQYSDMALGPTARRRAS